MNLSDFGVCEGGACEVNFSKAANPEFVEFDEKVASRRAWMESLLAERKKDSGITEPERSSLIDLLRLTETEVSNVNKVLEFVNPDDVFFVVDVLSPAEKAAFIAGFAVGRSI